MNKYLLAGALALASIANAQASEYRQGDWVLAQVKESAYWFPGVVEESRGDRVTIAFDDGERATRPSSDVKPYNWRAGSTVECRWKGGSEWYRGRIDQVSSDGESISVSYEDGDRERTQTRKCRSR